MIVFIIFQKKYFDIFNIGARSYTYLADLLCENKLNNIFFKYYLIIIMY